MAFKNILRKAGIFDFAIFVSIILITIQREKLLSRHQVL